MDLFNEISRDNLAWIPNLGIGYYPVRANPYDEAYFEAYTAIKATPIGLALNKARTDLVNKYTNGSVLDIGIGNGAFVEARENTFGFDINPVAVKWLIDRNKYRHPFRGAQALTFWDSLEHIHNPTLMLQGAKEFVFVSCPIYDDVEHVLRSKHFKPNEHCWYWTVEGLTTFMRIFGFEVQEINWMETEIGREDIGTFVFKRLE
jgi:hypothetical protein